MGHLARLQVFTLCLSVILVLSLTQLTWAQDEDKVSLGIQLMQQGDLEKALVAFSEAKSTSTFE